MNVREVIALLEWLVEDRARLSAVSEADRVALLTAAGRLSRPVRHESVRLTKALRRKRRRENEESDRKVRASTEIRAVRRADVFEAPRQLPPAERPDETPELKRPRACYVCKASFTKLHFFYDAMCPPCAATNYEKRFQTADLRGRTALVTGGRIKIGYQTVLMLLRAGARVLVTTRFPRDAALRFAREPDFGRFRERLSVFGLDLRHCPSVELFADWVVKTEERLDFLINNAAQTVRRPAAFYAHMLGEEALPESCLPEGARALLLAHERCKRALGFEGYPELGEASGDTAERALSFWRAGGEAVGVGASALLSQMPIGARENERVSELFPAGQYDADLQQVDRRRVNSWRMTLDEVPTPELVEVQLVNAIAPFVLCSRLKPLMMRQPTGDKHIVNVSAMEGQFARRTKTDKHPHTNMAKAALNMMTLTSAPDYAKSGIHMNAVDTGWVTDEDPIDISRRKEREHDFQPPLDIVDGAARILDPIFTGFLTGVHVSGKFLKDYAPASW